MKEQPINKNCLSYWFPLLQSLTNKVPKTRIIKTDIELLHLLDGKTPPGFDDLLARLTAAADEIGGFPVFLRTGQTSGKHYWKNTCYVPSADVLGHHIAELTDFSACADFMGLATDVWVVRQLLDLQTAFTAFGGFPVNRERRYFIEGGKVRCHHPYWPIGAVRQGTPEDADWEEKLAMLNHESPAEAEELTALAEHISRGFEGSWSLDFAADRASNWWAIDMALAEASFHMPSCQNCPPEMKEHYEGVEG